jgi:hypothetical protein
LAWAVTVTSVGEKKKTLKWFDDGAFRKRKYPTVVRRLVGERAQRRWLSYGLTQWHLVWFVVS